MHDRDIRNHIDAGKKLLEHEALEHGFELYQKIMQALASDHWNENLTSLLREQPHIPGNNETNDQLVARIGDDIDNLTAMLQTELDKNEKLARLGEIRSDLEKHLADLTAHIVKPDEDRPQKAEAQLMSRHEFLKKAALAGLGIALIPTAFRLFQTHREEIGEKTEKLHEAAYNTKIAKTIDPVLLTDGLASAYFATKVASLVKGGEIGKNDYYTAIAFLAARCLLGGKEVTHHTMEELSFGFESAALAVGLGFAAEGVHAQLPEILHAIKGEDATRAQTVAAIAAAGSVVSPMALTIGSCSAFGEEVRKVTTASGHFNEKAMGVLMSHLGDHSALGAGLYADPPDIPMAKLVGIPNMMKLKFVYGQVPALWSLYSTILKTNYLLNEDAGEDRLGKSMNETNQGLAYVLPALPAFIAHSFKNLAMYAFQQPQGDKGAKFSITSRMGEAVHNLYEIVTRKNPACYKVFANYHAPMSNLIKDFSDATTSYAQGKLDGPAARVEELLKQAPQDVDVRPIIEMTKQMIAPGTAHETSINLLHAIWDKIDETCGADSESGRELKAQTHTLWLLSDVLHRQKDQPVENVYQLVFRLTEKARLADAFGHGQMDVLTLLPWQILLSVPISNVLKKGLESVVDAGVPAIVTTLANMGLTGAVTGTVDNLAAFLASSNASIKAGQPRLMEALMASIAFGSATWAGNPIAHGKIASAATHPSYGIPESLKALPLNLDVYGITVGWTMLMNSMDMERRILGDAHPMYKGVEKSPGGPQPHHG